MTVHFSYKHTAKSDDLEKLLQRRVDKINRLLPKFAPDLVSLHGTLELRTAREGFATSLNLRLPIGQIYSAERGSTAPVSIRAAFDDLERQLQREKELLRGDGKTHPKRAS